MLFQKIPCCSRLSTTAQPGQIAHQNAQIQLIGTLVPVEIDAINVFREQLPPIFDAGCRQIDRCQYPGRGVEGDRYGRQSEIPTAPCSLPCGVTARDYG